MYGSLTVPALPPGVAYISVSVGTYHSCGVTNIGTAECTARH